jgi:hypothetical protein
MIEALPTKKRMRFSIGSGVYRLGAGAAGKGVFAAEA